MLDRFCLMPMPDSQMHDDLLMGTTRPGHHRTTKPEDHRARGTGCQRTAERDPDPFAGARDISSA